MTLYLKTAVVIVNWGRTFLVYSKLIFVHFFGGFGSNFFSFCLDDHYLGAEKKQGLFQSSAIVTNMVFAVVLVHNLVFNKLTSFFFLLKFVFNALVRLKLMMIMLMMQGRLRFVV